MKKLIKKKKNPKKSLTVTIDTNSIELLIKAINKCKLFYISQFLSFSRIGYELCSDCGESYINCGCEGSRDIPNGVCEDCEELYCICDYNLNQKSTCTRIINVAVKLAIEYFDSNRLFEFRRMLFSYFNHWSNPMVGLPVSEREKYKKRILLALKILNEYLRKI